jgi:hypothetical protein
MQERYKSHDIGPKLQLWHSQCVPRLIILAAGCDKLSSWSWVSLLSEPGSMTVVESRHSMSRRIWLAGTKNTSGDPCLADITCPTRLSDPRSPGIICHTGSADIQSRFRISRKLMNHNCQIHYWLKEQYSVHGLQALISRHATWSVWNVRCPAILR